MKLKNIKYIIVATIMCLACLSPSHIVFGQNKESKKKKTVRKATKVEEQQEIQMLLEVASERRQVAAEQQRIVDELKEAIRELSGGEAETDTDTELEMPTHKPTQVSTQEQSKYGTERTAPQQRVTADNPELELKYQMELQVAEKEIDRLRRQLATEYGELNQYQVDGATNDRVPTRATAEDMEEVRMMRQELLEKRDVQKRQMKELEELRRSLNNR